MEKKKYVGPEVTVVIYEPNKMIFENTTGPKEEKTITISEGGSNETFSAQAKENNIFED